MRNHNNFTNRQNFANRQTLTPREDLAPRPIECNRLQTVHSIWARTVEPHLDLAIVCTAVLLAKMLGRVKKVKTTWGIAVFN